MNREKFSGRKELKMSLTDGNGNDLIMPVQPMYGGGNGYGNGFGGDWAW